MTTTHRKHAVVLGASMGGLFAAAVLADEYDRVTLVERDPVAAAVPSHRRGVPQSRHAHALLGRGQQVMEELLPGLTAEVVGAGAHVGDLLANVRWYLRGRLLRQAETGLLGVSASRPLLEGAVRARVFALPGVTVLEGHDIVGLAASADGRVSGARVQRPGEPERVLDADLVVDATGRGSRTPSWLGALGYRPPAEDRVDIGLRYASRVFTFDGAGSAARDALGDSMAVVLSRYPGQNRGGIVQVLEGGRCLVTLGGVGGERPPLDLDGFRAYARTLVSGEAYEVARSACPVGDPAPFRMPTYVRRRYERMERFPAGVLVIGDAVCNFNPVYGQGMAVAAMDALVLRDELRRGEEPSAARYFGALAEVLEAPWTIAVGADMAAMGRLPASRRARAVGTYLARLQAAAAEDAALARAFIRVTSLVDPPSALLRPTRAVRVLARQGRSRPALPARSAA
jgi:2-polyprenyl-6-methoxyphenol hydroxylase-like FAD-dependent oxidoreductase